VDDNDRRRLTQLVGVLGAVDGWTARVDPDSRPGRPSPRSIMAIDDGAADPYRISHGAWHSLSVAVDLLSCLRTLLKDVRVIHMFAPCSLLRSALENASTAVWLLQPDTGSERLTRRLRQTSGDIRQAEEARCVMGEATSRSKEERIKEVQSIARRAGIDEGKAIRGAGPAEIVGAAGAELPFEPRVSFVSWKLCSGMTHGDFWAVTAGMDQLRLPGAPAGMAALRLSANVSLLMHLTMVATGRTRRGWELYDRLSR
jgi:hypothetical protein